MPRGTEGRASAPAEDGFDPARLGASAGRNPALGAILAEVLDRLSAGVIVYDGNGECLHVNRAAGAIVARGDGLGFDRRGVLHACDRVAERALALARLAPLDAGGRIIRVPRREGHAYPVQVTPIACGSPAQPGRAGRLVLIHDPDLQFPAMAREIAHVFGMPIGPARVVVALAQGDDLKTYAKKRGLSYSTVRYHLKIAFARTGMHTQSRLVQRATRVLTEFGVGEQPGCGPPA